MEADHQKKYYIQLCPKFLKKNYMKRFTSAFYGCRKGNAYLGLFLRILANAIVRDGKLRYSKADGYNIKNLCIDFNCEDEEFVREAIEVMRHSTVISFDKDGTLVVNPDILKEFTKSFSSDKRKDRRDKKRADDSTEDGDIFDSVDSDDDDDDYDDEEPVTSSQKPIVCMSGTVVKKEETTNEEDYSKKCKANRRLATEADIDDFYKGYVAKSPELVRQWELTGGKEGFLTYLNSAGWNKGDGTPITRGNMPATWRTHCKVVIGEINAEKAKADLAKQREKEQADFDTNMNLGRDF